MLNPEDESIVLVKPFCTSVDPVVTFDTVNSCPLTSMGVNLVPFIIIGVKSVGGAVDSEITQRRVSKSTSHEPDSLYPSSDVSGVLTAITHPRV